MAGVYFYVPGYKIQDIIDCGIKLSEWYDREAAPNGQVLIKRALRALINPWDDAEKAKDEHYRCIRIDVDPELCQVGDGDLYRMGLKNPVIMRRYQESMVPLSKYNYGLFRNPECLVFTSIMADRIEVTGKAKDIPVLFESSEALYLGNIMDQIEEVHKDSGNTLLYAYYTYLESQGQVDRVSDHDSGITLFINKSTGQYIVTKTPSGG